MQSFKFRAEFWHILDKNWVKAVVMDRGRSLRPSHSVQNVTVFTTPLLSINDGSNPPEASSSSNESSNRSLPRRASIRGAARFLRRASGRRIMREPSRLVREAAADELEERQTDWAYSRPVVVLDFLWNLVFVCIAVVVLSLSARENPRTPLRVWIVGYALQCALHMMCVWFEYRRRLAASSSSGGSSDSGFSRVSGVTANREDEFDISVQVSREHASIAKWLESANTMFSFIWWVVGFYWITAGADDLSHDAPLIYWLCVVFLAFDVFFVVFCVALACVIGIAVCCCLPCIIAIMYAMADQEGAPEEDINLLPKFKFHRTVSCEKIIGEKSGPVGGIMSSTCTKDSSTERFLHAEDADCCICLSAYEDGTELRELPCGHHFHCSCVDKWLRINATCPLCKYNIIMGSSNGRDV